MKLNGNESINEEGGNPLETETFSENLSLCTRMPLDDPVVFASLNVPGLERTHFSAGCDSESSDRTIVEHRPRLTTFPFTPSTLRLSPSAC